MSNFALKYSFLLCAIAAAYGGIIADVVNTTKNALEQLIDAGA